MKKKAICCCLISLALLLSCVASVTEASAAKNKLETSRTQKIRLLRLGAKNYQIDYQKQILIEESATLKVEGDLEDSTVSFKSSDSSVLSVQKTSDDTCTYTGESSGTATLTVRIRTNKNLFFQNKTKTLKAKIFVSPKAVSIKFRRAKIKMTVGQKKKIKTVIRPSISKEKPMFTSLDPEIAYFQSHNALRAKEAGSTYITAAISNGMKVRCKVIIKNKPNPPNPPEPSREHSE